MKCLALNSLYMCVHVYWERQCIKYVSILALYIIISKVLQRKIQEDFLNTACISLFSWILGPRTLGLPCPKLTKSERVYQANHFSR